MEKLVYLLWRSDGAEVERVGEELLRRRRPWLLEQTRGNVTVLLADVAEHLRAPIEPPLVAAVSFWLDSVDHRGPLEEGLREVAPNLAGYLVTESVPRDYADRTWSDGERSPGVTMIALIRRPARLTHEQFIEHWHGSHTPKSLEIHPLKSYIRNVVARPLTPGAPDYQGIVPEGLESVEHFFDPKLLYGSKANQQLMVEDMAAFLDVDQVHWTITSEYILRT